MIGKTLGQYEIMSVLGKGGMGEVYRARDSKLEREVALKVLPPDIADDPDRAERFRREALAVAALKHPNIVTLYSAENADGFQFLTMELVEGGDLRTVMQEDGIELDRFFDIAIPLAEAMSSAHDKGITHRDLKPGNILLDEEGRPQVLDFGLAQLIQEVAPTDATAVIQPELTTDGTVIGTVGYMAPEQAEGKDTDARSDIFSLGVILYELVTGQRPFDGDTSARILTSLLRDDPISVIEIRESLPEHLGRIIRRCLAKDPRERYQTARDLKNELSDLRTEITVEKHSGSRPAPTRRRPLVPVIAVLAVVAIAAVLFLMQSEPDQPDRVADDGPIRIVVLPMENLGAPDDEFFADGMTEEVTNRLSSISGLAVISRRSAETYAGREVSVSQIGEELDVDYVLAGSVRWAQDGDESRVRISPQLIRVADDTQLWAQSYDRTVEDVFAIQTGIAREVIRELGVALVGTDAAAVDEVPTQNARAHELYLRAVARIGTYEMNDLVEIVALLEGALDEDPEFARAWAALARVRSIMIHFGMDVAAETVARARYAKDRALALAPGAAFAQVASGFFHYHALKDYAAAEAAFAEAAALTPNDPTMLRGLALVQRRQGQWAESTRNLQAAQDLNPRDPILIMDLLDQYLSGSRWEEADRFGSIAREMRPDLAAPFVMGALAALGNGEGTVEARRLLEATQDPTVSWVSETRGMVEVYDGNYELALEHIANSQSPIFLAGATARSGAVYRGLIHQLAGNDGEARGNLEFAVGQLESIIATRADAFRYETALGIVHAALGNTASATEHAERALELFPLERDTTWGPGVLMDAAMIYAMAGDLDEALECAEQGLAWPSYWTAERMRLDPWMQPITEHPDFEAANSRAVAHRAAFFEVPSN